MLVVVKFRCPDPGSTVVVCCNPSHGALPKSVWELRFVTWLLLAPDCNESSVVEEVANPKSGLNADPGITVLENKARPTEPRASL